MSPTRMNLLARRREIQAAAEGLVLLRAKREALMKEFFRIMEHAIAARESLTGDLKRAGLSLDTASSLLGPERLKALALGTGREGEISVTERNIWGTRFPEIETVKPIVREPWVRGYSPLGVPVAADETVTDFEKAVETLVKMTSREMRLKRVGDEIKRVTRRVNALSERVIPGLQADARFIRQTLEEREREDLFRLKHLKRGRERRWRREDRGQVCR